MAVLKDSISATEATELKTQLAQGAPYSEHILAKLSVEEREVLTGEWTERDSDQATLLLLRERIDKLELLRPTETRACCVCLQTDLPICDGLECKNSVAVAAERDSPGTGPPAPAENHFTCYECMQGWVTACCEETSVMALEGRKAKILCPRCPPPGATQAELAAASLLGNCCRSEPFPDFELMQHLSQDNFYAYLTAQFRFVDSSAFQRVLLESGGSITNSHELLSRQLRAQIRDPRQCGHCGAGPVDMSV